MHVFALTPSKRRGSGTRRLASRATIPTDEELQQFETMQLDEGGSMSEAEMAPLTAPSGVSDVARYRFPMPLRTTEMTSVGGNHGRKCPHRAGRRRQMGGPD